MIACNPSKAEMCRRRIIHHNNIKLTVQMFLVDPLHQGQNGQNVSYSIHRKDVGLLNFIAYSALIVHTTGILQEGDIKAEITDGTP